MAGTVHRTQQLQGWGSQGGAWGHWWAGPVRLSALLWLLTWFVRPASWGRGWEAPLWVGLGGGRGEWGRRSQLHPPGCRLTGMQGSRRTPRPWGAAQRRAAGPSGAQGRGTRLSPTGTRALDLPWSVGSFD